MCCRIPLNSNVQHGTSKVTKNRSVGRVKSKSEWGMKEEYLLTGIRFILEGDENILKLDSGDGCRTLRIY